MALEAFVRFEDKAWLHANTNKIITLLKYLDSFVFQASDTEFWLKDKASQSDWEFDVRIFLQKKSLLIEASSTNLAYHRDVKKLLDLLKQETEIKFTDEDGEELNI